MTVETALGATYLGGGSCRFLVWAPLAQRMEVHIIAPQERLLPMHGDSRGYYHCTAEAIEPGSSYVYRIDGGKERPDPASRFQAAGVHGPSVVVDRRFAWQDAGWSGLPLQKYVIYELHLGTFTSEGTFDAAIRCLDRLVELGITAVELMPVAQFPGNRNWGYDGAYPFAVQQSYGGPQGFKAFIDACHQKGMAVVLDVVYNHLGPEGNYLADYGPYFSDRYKTPWGAALNFDGPGSDEVRRFFVENALYWITEFHVDSLRLDALHAILDTSAYPFLQELAESVHGEATRLGRLVYLIGESDLNDPRLLRTPERGGCGLDALWNDDFHHCLHSLLTGEKVGYYRDFGQVSQLAKSLEEGFVYSGQYSEYRRRRHGASSADIPARCFVVFAQNHDQVGNRMLGDRLSQLVGFDKLKLAAATVLLSPFIPLIFMGEEYGEEAPFPYFVSHSDPDLIEATLRGRSEEFAAFQWQGDLPDPQDEATFLAAKLTHDRQEMSSQQRTLASWYRELLRLRREMPPLSHLSKEAVMVLVQEESGVLLVHRWNGEAQAIAMFHFANESVSTTLPVPRGTWTKQLDSAEGIWGGTGSHLGGVLVSEGEAEVTLEPWSFALFTAAKET